MRCAGKDYGFVLFPVLIVLTVLSTLTALLTDSAINAVNAHYTATTAQNRYIEQAFDILTDFQPMQGVRGNSSSVWITSLSRHHLIPDWSKLLHNALRCPSVVEWKKDSDSKSPISIFTCTNITVQKDSPNRLLGNLLLDTLTVDFPYEDIQEPIQIIASGNIKLSMLKASYPTLFVSASGIEIDAIQSTAHVYLLANDEVIIKQNLSPHLTKIYPNFHLALDQIQSSPIGYLVETVPPLLYGFWFDRDS